MLRLFAGLSLPDPVKDQLASLNGGLGTARWIARENMHVTLRFMGEVDEDVAEELDVAIAAIQAPRFQLQITGVGCFESRQRVRAVWAGVKDQPLLTQLKDKVEAAMIRCGLEPEGRKFKPHVTLARLKNLPAAQAQPFLETHGGLSIEPFVVDRFHLFRSYLGKSGAHYEALADYPLDG